MNQDKMVERLMKGLAADQIAATKELESWPDEWLVRYLDGAPSQLERSIPLGDDAVQPANQVIAGAAQKIRNRVFNLGPAAHK